jgi:hypothetical protein
MIKQAPPTTRLLRAALLILLLLAQGVASAHAFEHWGQPAQELCATCSIVSGLDAPMASAPPTLTRPEKTEFHFAYCSHFAHISAPQYFFQRAPPVYL